MCGIFGAVNIKSFFNENDKQCLINAVQLTNYRGPDAMGLKFYNSFIEESAQSNVFLGHNRLAIIDLSPQGEQPLKDVSGRLEIVFNGEIYNYLELKDELIAKGYVFRTKTDTEVILNIYKEYGSAGFSKMNGMWAFIIFDINKNKLIVSRDRFAVKPLYYIIQNDIYYFSSEIKQLLPFLENKPNIDRKQMYNYLINYIVDYSNDTFFQEVKKIPPKQNFILDIKNSKILFEQYWQYSNLDFSKRNKQDLIDEFSSLLKDSIKIRLRSDVNIGNTLSGGLDSSSIAVLADEISTSKILNLSVINDNPNLSEEKYIDILQQKKGINLKKINSSAYNSIDILDKVIWHNDEPILSLSTVAHYKMMKLFKQETDIKVILSGQGGDESLCGYNKYFFYNLKYALKEKKIAYFAKESLCLLPKFASEFKFNFAKRYIKNVSENTPNYISFKDKNEFILLADTLKECQILDIDKFSVPALTHYEDRTSMAHSLEIRLPFLDYRLVNFNLNLPSDLKINNGWSKYILRKGLKNHLPNDILYRKDKKGFTTDEDELLSQDNKNIILSLFDDSILGKLEILDTKKFLELINHYYNGSTKGIWVRDLHRVIFAEIWAKIFIN